MAHELIFEPHGVYWRFYGFLTMKKMLTATSELWSDPRWDNARYVIIDLTSVDAFDVEEEKVVFSAMKDNAASHTTIRDRIAVVVTHPKLIEFGGKIC